MLRRSSANQNHADTLKARSTSLRLESAFGQVLGREPHPQALKCNTSLRIESALGLVLGRAPRC